MHGDGEPGGRVDELLRSASPLVGGEQDALARRAEDEQPIEPALLEKRAEWADCPLVERVSSSPEGGDGGSERPVQHPGNLRFATVSALKVETDDGILRVTLARAERRNAFDAALIAELNEAFRDVGDARVVLLSGEGESFCAGADVEWMRSSIDLSYEENVQDARRLRQMLEAIDGCPAPVVARVHGHALGGGCGLVACVDIAVAAEGTQFAFSEVKLGIIPSVISPFALAKIGPSAARRYFVTGERFDAQTALRIGLVHEVAANVDEGIERVLAELRTAGPEAARAAKRLVLERPEGLATERRIAERRTSDEGQDGLRAFIEKRKPSWSD
jgi:methylglutaconyl-CoA hydratase